VIYGLEKSGNTDNLSYLGSFRWCSKTLKFDSLQLGSTWHDFNWQCIAPILCGSWASCGNYTLFRKTRWPLDYL